MQDSPSGGEPGRPLSTGGERKRAWGLAFRTPRDAARRRLQLALRREELAGLAFALRARLVAATLVALWLVTIVQGPQLYWYLGVVALLVVFGLVPHALRQHRLAPVIKGAFVVLDITVLTAVIMVPPPVGPSAAWPIQMRLKGQEYLYLLVYLAGAALSYAPLFVLWTGLVIALVWSAGFWLIYARPDTVQFSDFAPGLPSGEALRVVSDPRFVSVLQHWNQVALTLIVTGLLAAAVWRARQTLTRQTAAEVARADLARYVSPDVADAIAARPELGFGEPRQRRVAVLFADIVGFTSHAEGLAPERVVALLKSFQARACKIVFGHGGTLDKFLGDGFMATFGALEDDPEAARRALACAFALQEEMARWRRKREARGAPSIIVAIGVHYGPVVVGNVGAERRLEFTVVGDPVNVASRLERLTREQSCHIAVSREVLDAAGGPEAHARFQPRGPVPLRGRGQPVDLYVWSADQEARGVEEPVEAARA